MAHPEPAGPTLDDIRARARACGIEIAAEREAAVLAGARHLHDAAQRLERIAVAEDGPPELPRP